MSLYLREEFIAVDELSLGGVLKFMLLDVLPEGVDDLRPRFGVYTEQTRQPGV